MLWCLHLLDEPHVRGEGRLELAPARPTYLLVYLACRGEWVSREALAGLLWPERPEDEARHSLRVSLHRARSLPWAKSLEAERERLRLTLGTDVAEFRAAIGRADWGAALAWHRRPFLEGFPLHDVPVFEEWASLERQALLEAWQGAALRHAEGLLEQGEYPQAAHLLGELLRHNPLAEDVLQGYLRAAYLAGERETALRTYERFAQELRRELDLEPMEATVELAQSLRRSLPLELRPAKPLPRIPLEVLRPPHLVGREGEQAWLRRVRLALVWGEPGVGKTRLLQETFPQASLIRCREGLENLPFYPVLEHLKAHLDGLPDLGPYREDLARLLPEAWPGFTPPPADPLSAKARLFEALARALKPLEPLVMDDLQWADEGTLELLVYVGNRGQRIVGAYRAHEVGPALAHTLETLRAAGAEELRLEPLGQSAVGVLLGHLIGSAEGPPRFTAWLHKNTGGNPFFALETLKALFENRVLWAEGGEWHTDLDGLTRDYSELQVPPRVATMVRRQVERLSEPARRVVQAASVVREGFSSRLLAGVVGLSEWAALEALEEAEAVGLVKTGQFSHDLTRQSIYHGLSLERRQALHRRVAEQIEGAPPQVRAEHWLAGGELALAYPYLWAAAREAQGQGLYEQAVTQLEWALGCAPGTAETLQVQLELARLDFLLARHSRAEERVAQVLAEAAEPGLLIQGLHLKADLRLHSGQIAEAKQVFDQGFDLCREHGLDPLPLHRIGAEIAYLEGRYKEAKSLLTQAIEHWRQKLPSSELASLLTSLGAVLDEMGQYDEGLALHLEAHEIARRLHDRPNQVNAAVNLLWCLMALGRTGECPPLGEAALELGEYANSATLRSNLAAAYFELGRDLEAAHHLEILVCTCPDPTLACISWARLARIQHRLGRPEQCHQSLERGLELLPQTEFRTAHVSLAISVLQLGDDAQVERIKPYLSGEPFPDPPVQQQLEEALRYRFGDRAFPED